MTEEEKAIYTLEEAAKELGMAYSTIYRHTRADKIKTVPWGEHRRITKAEIERIKKEGF